MTEALEKEAEKSELSPKIAHNIFVTFIELAQNLLNYSKKLGEDGKETFDPKGILIVGKDENGYYVYSQNIVSKEDKEKIEARLKEIEGLSKEEIKKLYKEARRSGRDTHHKGGGIGFLEIAKRAESYEYEFDKISDDRYFYKFRVNLGKGKGED
ncbi:MAG: hypothetical protein GXO62_03950 [Epsilonproteobacteria bacterium]|nr:hypothetical protein [Campylobacterota bacterium]